MVASATNVQILQHHTLGSHRDYDKAVYPVSVWPFIARVGSSDGDG